MSARFTALTAPRLAALTLVLSALTVVGSATAQSKSAGQTSPSTRTAPVAVPAVTTPTTQAGLTAVDPEVLSRITRQYAVILEGEKSGTLSASAPLYAENYTRITPQGTTEGQAALERLRDEALSFKYTSYAHTLELRQSGNQVTALRRIRAEFGGLTLSSFQRDTWISGKLTRSEVVRQQLSQGGASSFFALDAHKPETLNWNKTNQSSWWSDIGAPRQLALGRDAADPTAQLRWLLSALRQAEEKKQTPDLLLLDVSFAEGLELERYAKGLHNYGVSGLMVNPEWRSTEFQDLMDWIRQHNARSGHYLAVGGYGQARPRTTLRQLGSLLKGSAQQDAREAEASSDETWAAAFAGKAEGQELNSRLDRIEQVSPSGLNSELIRQLLLDLRSARQPGARSFQAAAAHLEWQRKRAPGQVWITGSNSDLAEQSEARPGGTLRALWPAGTVSIMGHSNWAGAQAEGNQGQFTAGWNDEPFKEGDWRFDWQRLDHEGKGTLSANWHLNWAALNATPQRLK